MSTPRKNGPTNWEVDSTFFRADEQEVRRRAGARHGLRLDSPAVMRLIGLAVILALNLGLAPIAVAEAQQAGKQARIGVLMLLELTRFRGHPMVGAERSVHDAEEPSAVRAGVPAADRRVGPQRADP